MDQITNFHELVTLDGDKLVTDSLKVARDFNKAHKTVLRSYDNLKCSPEFSRRNFAPSDYIDDRGKPQRSIKMTKDGFTMLGMGFTGQNGNSIQGGIHQRLQRDG